MDLNQVNLIGRLTKEPDNKVKKNKEGKDITISNFAIAINGKTDKDTIFVDIVAFGTVAENIKKYVSQGDQVSISGSLSPYTYTNKEGKKVTKMTIKANNVQYLQKKKGKPQTLENAFDGIEK